MKQLQKNKGFTLVELMVSVGITAIMMVGISTFFSSTFRNMFLAREKVTTIQGQFVVTTILNGKFENVESLDPNSGCPPEDCKVLRNGVDSGDLPFTYIGTESAGPEEYAVFKDFFVFNGMFGNNPSTNSGLTNPGGVTRIGAGDYYVTSPTTDEIYKCTNANMTGCNPFSVSEALDQPIDVTNDGTDIYVTDAGNDRVIKIAVADGMVTEIVTGLNFPTGIEFYLGTNYLFVSDTYNHLVKKVDIMAKTAEVIVGSGKDELCDDSDGRDHSASSCKLNFPTGLVIGDDNSGDGDELYISDTGNGRVLKVSDPTLDLTDLELEYTLDVGSQISYIDFTLPDTSVITSVSQGASGNTLRDNTGFYKEESDTVARFMLSEELTNVTITSPGICPPSCTDYITSFDADNAGDIFKDGDSIYIDGNSYTVNANPAGNTVSVSLDTTIPSVTDIAHVNDIFSNDDYTFYVDLSDVTLPIGFQNIDIEAFDRDDATINDDDVFIRIGDGELGTFEDIITELSTHDYPTGLGFYSNAPQISGTTNYSTGFSEFDYTSGFEVQGFEFSTPNGGDILELFFEAKLSGTSEEENEVWEDYTLNADLTP